MTSISGLGGLTPAQQAQIKRFAEQSVGNGVSGTAIAEAMLNSLSSTVAASGQQSQNPIMALFTNILGGIFGAGKAEQAGEVEQTGNTAKSDPAAVEKAKQAATSDFVKFKNAGVEVSDWDANNTCTLSHNGKTATVTISGDGNVSFGGDIEAIAEHVKSSDPKQKEAVDNQNKFLADLEKQGIRVLSDPKTTSVKVNGKDTSVLEYATSQGFYYLDDSGKQVTPDS